MDQDDSSSISENSLPIRTESHADQNSRMKGKMII